MTEVDAAIGIEQFKKMDYLNARRIELVRYLSEKIKNIEGLAPPVTYEWIKHVYYIFAVRYDEGKIGIPRDLFLKALNAEGIPFSAGYVRPLYLSPIYHDNKPFFYRYYQGNADYSEGICPVAERLHKKELITTILIRPPATFKDMDDIVNAIKKVISNKREFL